MRKSVGVFLAKCRLCLGIYTVYSPSLYYDNVNVVNPLTTKVHKIGFFSYYQLPKICNKNRSKLESIRFFSTCNAHHNMKYGRDKTLEPLVEELQILASDSGYPIEMLVGKFIYGVLFWRPGRYTNQSGIRWM